ncbi:hypothetical protein ABE458_23700 [Pseudomonas protegens]|uniref:hypothetical protein n=1 Tax=Pseudomonas protegens TaxID=380021 RepID=UPI00320A075B
MRIELESEAGVLRFFVKSTEAKNCFFDFDVVCDWNKKFSGCLPDRVFCSLNFDDIKRLVEYFHRHKLSVLADKVDGALVFMPLENDFQIRLMAGEADSLEEGYFWIGFLFNFGGKDEDSSNVYFGFEASIEFSAVDDFCSSLMGLIPDK